MAINIGRREFISMLSGVFAMWPALARGQQNRKPWRIAIPGDIKPSAATARRLAAFRDGLMELGYAEGRNIVIDYRDASGSRDSLIALCKDMIEQGADVIVASSTNSALAAQATTKTVPIVMRAAADPVAVGLVGSLARPGGNITGVTSLANDLSAKRLGVLKELLPQLQRVAVLWEPNSAAGRDSIRETEVAARTLRIDIESFGVNRADDLAEIFQSIATGRFDAIDVLAGPIVTENRARILALCSQARMPGLYQERPFVEAGGLLSYGPNFERLFHRMAYYVDRIIKGAKPADLPVERPTKFELFINLKTARALGLEIPTTLLAIADGLIE
ncbi:ABC transporter substrate-binding protein [Bradyrhizobium sp.]|uniref:ABC transporter substrate-binding protein n=1 Tax=Bradyrhizobium sp. TaxID=376 RepID=UPI002D62E80B|nr:ABC transporter substrate-binding protein [Bradyrhizobium sp.]HZR75928.1 ABC transporter substrate-binding protein [Bradyrhizobium sp.]